MSRDLWRLGPAVVAAVALAGCSMAATAPSPDPLLAMRYDKGVEAFDLDSLVARAAPGPVAVIDLGRTAWVSHHVAIVREEEQPHYHRFHDVTVVVLRGEGIMDIEGRRVALKAGDVTYVQRGVRHYFRNTGKDLAAAFVTFSPPFDGRDMVTAELPAEAAPPAAVPASPAPPPSPQGWWRFWGRDDASEPTPKP